jgi:hypothetical protein
VAPSVLNMSREPPTANITRSSPGCKHLLYTGTPALPDIIRLLGAVLAEQNDEWIEARRLIELLGPRTTRDRRFACGAGSPEQDLPQPIWTCVGAGLDT